MKIIVRFIISILLISAASVLTADAQKFDRGLNYEKAPMFLPAGNLMIGGTASYEQHGLQDFKFTMLSDINVKGYALKATPYVYCTFYRNMALGVRFSYKRTMADIKAAKIAINDDLQFEFDDIYAIQHTYYGSLSYRYYVPLFGSKVFALFSDIGFSAGAGQGKILNKNGDFSDGTYQKILDLSLEVTPGLIFFVANEMAIEASIQILRVGWKNVQQTSNQIYLGRYDGVGATFNINLLSINLGVDFVIPLGNKKITR